ncbi:MAG: redoxin domain-containing protein [Proteiniphilum sp.]|nr:redoxin domain-containing protein [Proteiniphilum sp.]
MTRNIFITALSAIFFIGFSFSVDSTNPVAPSILEIEQSKSDGRQFKVKEGDMAPDFEMAMPDGSTVKLSDLRGKVVMLQFTASWCGVCRKEMPHIEKEIWLKHKNNPEFALFGIAREEPAEKIELMRKATEVTYPIGMDTDASIFCKYAECNAGITRNIIIDREGKIVMLTRLFEEEEFNKMVTVINELVAKD